MLVSQLADWTQDMWSAIIGLFSFIPSWGWMIIVFTIVLKLVLSPLDYWQKKLARKNSKKQAMLQPEIAKLQKKYSNNRQVLNQKTMELYKRENYNIMGSCLGMLLNMAITLFIFFTLFSGLSGMSRTEILNQYETLESNYNKEFANVFEIDESEVEATEQGIWNNAMAQAQAEFPEGPDDKIYTRALEIFASNEKIALVQSEVKTYYDQNVKEGFLWVKNIWRPDTNASAFSNYNTFVTSCDFYNNSVEYKAAIAGKTEEEIKVIRQNFLNKYNFVTYDLQEAYNGVWNGYFILVVLSAVITYFSASWAQMESKRKAKKKSLDQNAETKLPQVGGGAMKIMKFVLPIMMVIFTIGYSAAFALYIVTNSFMSMISSIVFLKYFEHKEKTEPEKFIPKKNNNRPEYSRENVIDASYTKIEEKENKLEDKNQKTEK